MLKSKAPSTANRRTYGKQKEINISKFSGVATGFRKFQAPSNRVAEIPKEKILRNPTLAEDSVPDHAVNNDQCRATNENSNIFESSVPTSCSPLGQSVRENQCRNRFNHDSLAAASKSSAPEALTKSVVNQVVVDSAPVPATLYSTSSEVASVSSKTNRHKLRLKRNPQHNLGRSPLGTLSAFELTNHSLAPKVTSPILTSQSSLSIQNLSHGHQEQAHYEALALHPHKTPLRLQPERLSSLPTPVQCARDTSSDAHQLSPRQLQTSTATDDKVGPEKSTKVVDYVEEDCDGLVNTPEKEMSYHPQQGKRRLCKKQALATAVYEKCTLHRSTSSAYMETARTAKAAICVEFPHDSFNSNSTTAAATIELPNADVAEVIRELPVKGKVAPRTTTTKNKSQSQSRMRRKMLHSKSDSKEFTKAVRGGCENCDAPRNGMFKNGCSCSKDASTKISKRAIRCPASKDRAKSVDSESSLRHLSSSSIAEGLIQSQGKDTSESSNKTSGSPVRSVELLCPPEATQLGGPSKKRSTYLTQDSKQDRKKSKKRPRAKECPTVEGNSGMESSIQTSIAGSSASEGISPVNVEIDLTCATWFCAGCSLVHKEDLCNAVWPFKKKCGWLTHGLYTKHENSTAD